MSSSHPTDFQGSVPDAAIEAIQAAIPGAKAQVSGGGGHYEIDVVAPAFEGKSSLERQRMVLRAISPLMKGDAPAIHAVDSLKTRTP